MSKVLYKELSFEIIGAAMEVHSTPGPGFLEGIYLWPGKSKSVKSVKFVD